MTGNVKLYPEEIAGTFAEYARRWLEERRELVREQSHARYERLFRRYILPHWGRVPVEAIDKESVRRYLSQILSRLALGTVAQLGVLMQSVLRLALEDGSIRVNPVEGVGRKMKLQKRARAAARLNVRAFTQDELRSFLEAAEANIHRLPFLTLAWSGLRIGEALALMTGDIDERERVLYVSKSTSDRKAGKLEPTKSGLPRNVEIPAALVDELTHYIAGERRRRLAELGLSQVPFVFFTRNGTPLERRTLERAFKALLLAVDLPSRHTPHSLRHTYASLLLQQGVDIAYVARQLGHSSVDVTEHYYGRWLPVRRPEALEQLTFNTLPRSRKNRCFRKRAG